MILLMILLSPATDDDIELEREDFMNMPKSTVL
jgi:hypothetical protein